MNMGAYMTKARGDTIPPWGTPDSSITESDILSPIFTLCDLWLKKEWNQLAAEDFSNYQKLWDSLDYREKVDKGDTNTKSSKKIPGATKSMTFFKWSLSHAY